MVTESVSYREYNGSLLTTQLLSSRQTIVLNAFGPSQGGSVSDESGVIYVGEEVTVDGRSMVLLGSGTAQAGVSALGATVGVGAEVPVLLMRDTVTGEIFFVFPDGQPSAIGMIAMVVDIEAKGYSLDGGPPICFCEGTRILTARGEVPVEELRAGDLAVTHMGELLPVLWVGMRHYPFGAPEEHRPIVLRPGAMGPDLPKRPLKLSPQHRLVLGAEGGERKMGPAKALLGEACVHQQKQARPVTYYHVLMPRHAVLMAEGVPTESLFLGAMSMGILSETSRREVCDLLGCEEAELGRQPQAQPRCTFLSRREAQEFRAARQRLLAPEGERVAS